jgi:hypothetical protein
MGLGRRIVRESVRRVTPKPVRKAMHPVRTVKNAVTPRPVKQVSRAAYTVRHPVGAAENEAIGAVLYAGHRKSRRRRRGLLSWLFGGARTTVLPSRPQPLPPPPPAAPPGSPHANELSHSDTHQPADVLVVAD